LSKPSTSSYTMQVGGWIFGEIEIDDNIDTGNIDPPGDKVWADQDFELAFSKSLEYLDALFFHCWGEVLVLETFTLHFFGEVLRTFVRTTEDDTLVDY
jgi:hypothetical protein